MGTVNTVTLVAQLITSHRSDPIMRSFKFLTFLFLLGAASAASINVNDEGGEVAAEEENYDYSYDDDDYDEYDYYDYEEEEDDEDNLEEEEEEDEELEELEDLEDDDEDYYYEDYYDEEDYDYEEEEDELE